jgi:hypothetical protein
MYNESNDLANILYSKNKSETFPSCALKKQVK